MKNLYPVVPCNDVAEASAFYGPLLGLERVFEADWYVQMQDPTSPHVEIAFVQVDHPSVPAADRMLPRGVIVTVETDDVDEVHERARKLGHDIVQELRDEDWGQRHFMTRDPMGLVVDVVKVITPSDEFTASHQDGEA